MKITPADFKALEEAVAEVLKNHPNVAQKYKDQGLSETRFRWDVLHVTKATTNLQLYNYLNDSHIDTALKRIMPAPYA